MCTGPTYNINSTINSTCVAKLDQIISLPANCTWPYARADDNSCRIRCPRMLWRRNLLFTFQSLTMINNNFLAPVWTQHNAVEFSINLLKILSPISLASMIACIALVIVGSGVAFPNDLTVNFMFVILLSQLQIVVWRKVTHGSFNWQSNLLISFPCGIRSLAKTQLQSIHLIQMVIVHLLASFGTIYSSRILRGFVLFRLPSFLPSSNSLGGFGILKSFRSDVTLWDTLLLLCLPSSVSQQGNMLEGVRPVFLMQVMQTDGGSMVCFLYGLVFGSVLQCYQ